MIVDNASSDETSAVIERFKATFSGSVAVSFAPTIGLGNARNCGWTLAKGEIVVFTDDDCYPGEDFLVSVHRCFQEDHRIGFIGGLVLLHRPAVPVGTEQNLPSRLEFPPGCFIPAGWIQGGNLSCRREALESVGGFDGRFGFGALFGCEDVDLVARMSAAGWHGAFDPRPVVYHDDHVADRVGIARRMAQYDRGRGAYYAKCLLNPRLRFTYLRKWVGRMRHQPIRTTWRELIAGTEFILRNAVDRPATGR